MILVNGVVRSEVAATDRGLAYGDGVFRTLRARAGVPRQWVRQYAKLARDCAALELSCPTAAVLEDDVRAACEAVECAVKIIVTRGAAERGYRYTEQSIATRIVIATAFQDYAAAFREEGVNVRVCALRLAHQPALAGVKHLNRLENVLARAEWSDADIAEGILCDPEGNAICGTMTNLFLATGGGLVTPSVDRCGVGGVTRERVMEAAVSIGCGCEVRNVAYGELMGADEVFLTNSLAGVWPVRSLGDRIWSPGPVTRALQRFLDREDAS
jgi:4-amino-4-deoxychorismate lyase